MSDKNQAAQIEVAKQILSKVEGFTASLAEIKTQVADIKAKSDELSGLDIAATVKEVERQKAIIENVAMRVRAGSAGQLNLRGLEDEAQRFSLVRAYSAIATKDWSAAGFEKEVIDQATSRAKAAGVADVGERGGFFIPDAVLGDVIAPIYAQSAFINLAGDASAGQTRISVIDGAPTLTGTMIRAKAGCVSYWVGEEDNVTESFMSSGDETYNLKQLATMVRITKKMRDFGSYGWENLLRNDMIRCMALKLDLTIMYGSGTNNMPLGLANNPRIQRFSALTKAVITAASGPSAASNVGALIDYDILDEMVGVLEDANIAGDASNAFIAHPRAFRQLKRLRVQNYSGQNALMAYLAGRPRIPDSALAEVIGPFGKTTQIPTTRVPGQSVGWSTNTTDQKFSDIFYGRWSDMVMVRGAGISVEDDGGLGKGFASGHMYVKAMFYADWMYRYPEALLICPDIRVRD